MVASFIIGHLLFLTTIAVAVLCIVVARKLNNDFEKQGGKRYDNR